MSIFVAVGALILHYLFFLIFKTFNSNSIPVLTMELHCRENLTSYKELCNLATDLNQPDLIYKFMQLANHNILWNSKKVNFV